MQRDSLNVYLNFNAVNGDKLVSSVKSTFEQINTVVKNYTPAFPLNMDVKQIDKKLKVVTDEIMNYFPQSPAKKGALRGLENAGSEIIGQLMLGMDSSAYRLYKSVEYIASQILQPFKNLKEEFTEALSFNIDMTTYERYKYLENMFDISKSKLNEVSKKLKQLDYVQEKAVMSRMGGLDADNAMSYALRRADRKNTIDDLRFNAGLPGDILNNLKYIRKDIRELLAKQIDNLKQPFSDEIYTKILNIETLFKSLTYSSASLKDRAIVETINWLFPNIEDFLSGLVGYDVKIESILKDLSQFIQDIFNKILHFYTNNLKNFSLKDLFNSVFGGTKSELEAISDEFQWKLSNIPEQRLNTELNVTATKAIAYYGKKILESNGKNIYSLKDLNNEIKQYLENELNYLRKYDKASDTIPLLEQALQRIDKTFTNKELQKLFLKNKAPELAESVLDKGFSLKNATASSLKSLSDYEAEYIDSELKKYELEIERRKWERGDDYETEYYKRDLEREKKRKNIKNSDTPILESIEAIQNDNGFLENIFDNVYNKIAERLYYFANYVQQKIDSSPFLKKLENLITYFYNEFIQKPLDYAKKTKQNGFLSVFFNFMRIFWEELKGGLNNILDEENGWLGRIVKYFRDSYNSFKKWLGFEKSEGSGGSGGGANTNKNGLDIEKTKEQVYNLSTATAGNEVVNDTGGYVWEFTEKAQGFLDSVLLFLDDVYTSIQNFLSNLINQVKNSDWFNQLLADFSMAFDYFLNGDIRNAIIQTSQGLLNLFNSTILPFLNDFYNMLLPYIQNAVNTLFNLIINGINAVREPLFNLIKSISELLFGILVHAVLHPLMRELQDLGFKLLNQLFVHINALIANIVSLLLDSLLKGVRKLINIIFWDLGEAIELGLRDVHDKLVEYWNNTAIPYLKSIGDIIYYNVVPVFRKMKEKITKFITEKIEEIKNKLYNIIKKLKFWESDDTSNNVEASGGGSRIIENTEDTEDTEPSIKNTIDKVEETTEKIKEETEKHTKTQEKQLDEQKEQNKNNQKQAENQEETNALLKKQLEEDEKNKGIGGYFLAKYGLGAYTTSDSEKSKMPPLPTLKEAKDFLKSLIPGDLISVLFGGSGSTTTTDTNSNTETSQGSNNTTDNSLLDKAYETIKQYTNTDEIEKITNKIDNLLAVANDYPGIVEEFGVNTNDVLKGFIGKLSKLEPNKENLKILLNNSQDTLINEFYAEIEAKYTQTNLDKTLEQWKSKFDEIKQYGLEIPQKLIDKASEAIYSSIGTDELEKGFEFIREKIKAFEDETQIKIPIQLPIKEVGTAVSNMEQLMGNLYKLSGEQSKEFYTAQKAMSIISATISTYEAATKALNTGVYPMNLVNAGIVTAAGLANVALIASQSFSSGGQVQGKNTGKDDVPAMLMAGEYVIKKKAVDYLGLDYLNNLNNLTPQSASSSSDVAPAFTAQAQENQVRQPINNEISIVNYTDIKQFSQFLNTEEGKKSIVNIVAEKSSQLRSFFR